MSPIIESPKSMVRSVVVSVLSLPVDGITKCHRIRTNLISGRANWSTRCRLNSKIQMFYVVVHDCFFVGLQEYNTAHAINMIGLLYFSLIIFVTNCWFICQHLLRRTLCTFCSFIVISVWYISVFKQFIVTQTKNR